MKCGRKESCPPPKDRSPCKNVVSLVGTKRYFIIFYKKTFVFLSSVLEWLLVITLWILLEFGKNPAWVFPQYLICKYIILLGQLFIELNLVLFSLSNLLEIICMLGSICFGCLFSSTWHSNPQRVWIFILNTRHNMCSLYFGLIWRLILHIMLIS